MDLHVGISIFECGVPSFIYRYSRRFLPCSTAAISNIIARVALIPLFFKTGYKY